MSPLANGVVTVLAIALLVGFLASALVEWLQTGQLASIGRQFGTRTTVLIAIAIPMNIVLGQIVASALRLPIYLDSIGTILVGVLAGPIAGAATGLLSNLLWTFALAGTPFGSPFAWPFAIVSAEIGFLAGLFGYAGVFRSRSGTPAPKLVAGLVIATAVVVTVVWFGILPFYAAPCDATDGGVAAGACLELLRPEIAGHLPTQLAALGIIALLIVALVAVVVRVSRDRDVGVAFVLVAGVACGFVSALIASPIAALVFGGVTGSGTDLLVALFQATGEDLQTAVLQQSMISDSIDKTISFLVVFTILGALSRRVTARFPQGERALGTSEA